MAEFRSPFSLLGQPSPDVVHGQMQCMECYKIVGTGIFDAENKTLVYVCDDGHKTTLENYEL